MNLTIEKLLDRKIYTPLHVHTAKGSVGDSILKIKDYVKKAKNMGLTTLSITDHGSMANVYDFNSECLANDIKPILGCEVYLVDNRLEKDDSNFHIVLIAKNEIGFKNLLYIVSDANLNGFYYKPRTDFEILSTHGDGIIALSACLGGQISQMILTNQDEEVIIAKINQFKEMFDEFYLELQPGNFESQILVNEALVYLAEKTNTPLIITNDIHYLNEEDSAPHDFHVKVHRKKSIEDDPVYPDTCYYLRSKESLTNSFPYLNSNVVMEAINNTLVVSNQCNVNINTTHLHMPKFEVPDGYTEASFLAEICYNKLDEIKNYINDPSIYSSRLQYELETIEELGFSGYFLTVRDFIQYANKKKIPTGPGRGSVCGSLAAFLAEITQVDAVKYNLSFERFLSRHRKGSNPDIDSDYGSQRREEMFQYAVEKYGSSNCALVSTFAMRKAKASLRDTARVFNIPDEIADEAAKLIPEVYYDDEGEKTTDLSIVESIKIVPRLVELSEEYPEWFELRTTSPGMVSIKFREIRERPTLLAIV